LANLPAAMLTLPHRVAAAGARSAFDWPANVKDKSGVGRCPRASTAARAKLTTTLARGRAVKLPRASHGHRRSTETFGSAYEERLTRPTGPKGPTSPTGPTRLTQLEQSLAAALAETKRRHARGFRKRAPVFVADLESVQRDALLANPLLDSERLLVIKRKPIGDPRRSQWADRGLGEYIGVPNRAPGVSHGSPTSISGQRNRGLSPLDRNGRLTPLFTPQGRRLVTASICTGTATACCSRCPDAKKRWQVFEIRADGTGLRQLTFMDEPDVHCYDAIYLPDGNIAFISTAVLQGVRATLASSSA